MQNFAFSRVLFHPDPEPRAAVVADSRIELKGNGVAPGYGVGRAFIVKRTAPEIPTDPCPPDQVSAQIELFTQTLIDITRDLADTISTQRGSELTRMLRSHVMMLGDQFTRKGIENKISKEHLTAAQAVNKFFSELETAFSSSPQNVEKVPDMRDLKNRLVCKLLGINSILDFSHLSEPVVLIAEELHPSECVVLGSSNVIAMVLSEGGQACHAVIVAKDKDIPVVSGIPGIAEIIRNNEMVAVDAIKGLVYVDPSAHIIETIARHQQQLKAEVPETPLTGPVLVKSKVAVVDQSVDRPLLAEIKLFASITRAEDALQAQKLGMAGIGLYRTEFMRDHGIAFEEDSMFQQFATIASCMQGKPVTIRCPDFGADKSPEELGYGNDNRPLRFGPNPMLDARGTAFMLLTERNRELFRAFLRGAYRASVFGEIQLLFPQITDYDEFDVVRTFCKEAQNTLSATGQSFRKNVKLYSMAETPAAIEEIPNVEADGFSIGSNDLTSYALAVDRVHSLIGHNYNPHHPAIIKMLRRAVLSATRANKPISICGEIAGDLRYVPLLIGIGFRNFSVSPGVAQRFNTVCHYTTIEECDELAKRARNCKSPTRSMDLLRKNFEIIKERIKASQ